MCARMCACTQTHTHTHTHTRTHRENICIYNIYMDNRSSQTINFNRTFIDTNLELNNTRQNLSSVYIHEYTNMFTYILIVTHTHTHTQNTYLYIQRTSSEIRGLCEQLTPMGDSQTQILELKSSL